MKNTKLHPSAYFWEYSEWVSMVYIQLVTNSALCLCWLFVIRSRWPLQCRCNVFVDSRQLPSSWRLTSRLRQSKKKLATLLPRWAVIVVVKEVWSIDEQNIGLCKVSTDLGKLEKVWEFSLVWKVRESFLLKVQFLSEQVGLLLAVVFFKGRSRLNSIWRVLLASNYRVYVHHHTVIGIIYEVVVSHGKLAWRSGKVWEFTLMLWL